MRSLSIFAGLFLLASGQVALSADAADKPIVIAAVKMEALDVGPMPVSDGDHLCGILTDRDIAIARSRRDVTRTAPPCGRR